MSEARMYDDLAEWWPWISAPEEYATEAEIIRAAFRDQLGADATRCWISVSAAAITSRISPATSMRPASIFRLKCWRTPCN